MYVCMYVLSIDSLIHYGMNNTVDWEKGGHKGPAGFWLALKTENGKKEKEMDSD